MANYIESFKSKMPWSNVLERTDNVPLDRSSIFSSYSDAEKYAKGDVNNPDERGLYATSYIGQIITVYENDEVTTYKINGYRELEEIGQGKGYIMVSQYAEAEEYTQDEDNKGQLIYCIENDKKGLYLINEYQELISIIEFANDSETIIFDGGTF